MRQTTFILNLLEKINPLLVTNRLSSNCVVYARSEIKELFDKYERKAGTASFIELTPLLEDVRKQLDFFYHNLHQCIETMERIQVMELAPEKAAFPIHIGNMTIADLKCFTELFHTFDKLLNPDMTASELYNIYDELDDILVELQLQLKLKEVDIKTRLKQFQTLDYWHFTDKEDNLLESEGHTDE